MTTDPFGIDFIYPTKKNTVPFFMDNNNFDNQGRMEWGSKTTPQKTSGGFWEIKDNSQVRINFAAASKFKDTCTLDFKKAAASGSSGMSSPAWRDIEMTIRFKLTNFSPSDGRLILKGPTGRHHSNTVCCSGSCYGCRFFVVTNPMKVQWFKEMYHVHYDSRPAQEVSTKFGNLNDGNEHIAKFVSYNITVDGKLCQKLEQYIDFDGDGKKFIKVAETIDTGGWNDDGGRCNGDDDQKITWDNEFALFRWDASSTDIEFKDASCREIDPFASPDQTPTDPGGGAGGGDRPTTQRLIVPIVLSFDVNAYRFSKCATVGGGGGGGAAADPFYDTTPDHIKEISNNSSFSNRTIVAVNIINTASPFYNVVVKSFKAWLKKIGTPNTNNAVAKIWKAGTGLTVAFTSPTVVTDSSLPTSFSATTDYDFLTNTYIMKVGDRIGIEYLGTSSSNYIDAAYQTGIDGNGTGETQREGSSWDDHDTREMACKAYIGA